MIDKNAYVHPRTIPANKVRSGGAYTFSYLVEIAGYVLPVDIAQPEGSGRTRIGSAQGAIEYSVFLDREQLIEVLEFDSHAYKIDVAAEQMALADGSAKSWADLHEEDRERWRKMVQALVRSGVRLPDTNLSGLVRGPISDPAKGGK